MHMHTRRRLHCPARPSPFSATFTHRFAQAGVGAPHHRRRRHAGVLQQHPLHLRRHHILPAALDHVLHPPQQPQTAAAVDAPQVTGAQPAAGRKRRCRGLRCPPVSTHHMRPPCQHLPVRATVAVAVAGARPGPGVGGAALREVAAALRRARMGVDAQLHARRGPPHAHPRPGAARLRRARRTWVTAAAAGIAAAGAGTGGAAGAGAGAGAGLWGLIGQGVKRNG